MTDLLDGESRLVVFCPTLPRLTSGHIHKPASAAVLVHSDVLMLEILFFADEIRDPHREIDDLPGKVDLSQRERQMADQLIDTMSGPWHPPDYRDTYGERVNELIEAKIAHGKVREANRTPAQTDVSSLTEALQASLAAAKARSRKKRPMS
jgi:DNA end-binding protein Ku